MRGLKITAAVLAIILGAVLAVAVALPRGGASIATMAPAAPTQVQVILQGQSAAGVAGWSNSPWGGPPSSSSNLSPNLEEIGWACVAGATSYNILDNGSQVATESASAAATAYSTYVTNQGSYPTAPGIGCAYQYTSATGVISGTLGNVLSVTGSITSGNQLITLGTPSTNAINTSQVINGTGLPNDTCSVSSTSGSLPTLTVNLGCTTTAAETNETVYISNNGSFSATATFSNGATSMTVSAIQSQAVVAGQGFGGPGLPPGTVVQTFGSACTGGTSSGSGGAGTYCLNNAATATESSQTYGTVYLTNQPHLMQVEAVNGGGTSAVGTAPDGDTYANIPFITNGELICSAGVFNGVIVTGQTAPATTPLGYNDALEWQLSPSNYALINTYAGNSCAAFNIGVAGYNYVTFSIYPQQSGVSMQVNSEIGGDGVLRAATLFSTWSCGTLTANAWNTCKVPLNGANGMNIDSTTGNLGKTNVNQTSFYKYTWQLTAQPTTTYNAFVEIHMSVD